MAIVVAKSEKDRVSAPSPRHSGTLKLFSLLNSLRPPVIPFPISPFASGKTLFTYNAVMQSVLLSTGLNTQDRLCILKRLFSYSAASTKTHSPGLYTILTDKRSTSTLAHRSYVRYSVKTQECTIFVSVNTKKEEIERPHPVVCNTIYARSSLQDFIAGIPCFIF